MSTTALDATVAAIRPTAPTPPTAAKHHHQSYRQCVCLLAADNPIPPERHAEFTNAVTLLGITPDMLVKDVGAVKEAVRCQALASKLDELNESLRAVTHEQDAFEEEVVSQRAELADRRNALLSQIEIANNAAKTVARLEADNPRLAG